MTEHAQSAAPLERLVSPIVPFYDRDGITIYCGDARDVLPLVEVCDLLITDPPYGMSFRSNYGGNFEQIAGDDDDKWVPAVILQSLLRLRDWRHVYVFGRCDLSALPLSGRTELIWDKGMIGLGDLSSPWGPQHEPIQFATYVTRPSARSRNRGSLSARMRKGSVLRCQRANAGSATVHPNEKPVEILREMIESSSRIGETVLDPFCGSGSTLVAARMEGRRAIGIEISEDYCRIAVERLRQGVLGFDSEG